MHINAVPTCLRINCLFLKQVYSFACIRIVTLRQNRLNKVPIKNKKDMESEQVKRGESFSVYKDDPLCFSWK